MIVCVCVCVCVCVTVGHPVNFLILHQEIASSSDFSITLELNCELKVFFFICAGHAPQI